MEKSLLTRFERQCIQEEPPLCRAACPFHVDVKAFVGKMAVSAYDAAFKILEKALPLPEVLARVCDHPCENQCIRGPVDAAIAIGDLERFCVRNRSRQKKYFPPPPKDHTVGIWGSGPSSLAAAWDLSLKGYRVSVFFASEQPGGRLKTLSPAVLPPEVLDKEIRRMKGFGVQFICGTSLEAFEQEARAFHALFLGLDQETPVPKPEDLDLFTLRAGESNRFFGGFSEQGARETVVETLESPVWFAFQGRKAATSIDRMLAQVSMDAGRDREGPFETRLDTDTTRIVPAPRVEFSGVADDKELAAKEAARCHQCDCSRCIRACNTYIESFGGFPGKYAREIYNNLSIVMGERKANRLINSCTLCELCTTVCPNDFSMADLCVAARQEMVENGKMPPSAHEFALAEMAHTLSEACAVACHGRDQKRSEFLFFPGCQLIGSAPHQVIQVWQWLQTAVAPATGLVAGCCGAPAFWAGRQERFEAVQAQFTSLWTEWGEPEVITACTSCSRMLEKILPQEKICSVYEKMAEALNWEGSFPDPSAISVGDMQFAVSDPCTARDDAKIQAAVRTVAKASGVKISELAASGALTECCGFGGLTFNANPDLGKKIIEKRAGQSSLPYLTYCAMCRDRLARTGKPSLHLLDLFWPAESHSDFDACPDSNSCQDSNGCVATRPDPGFSRRRTNRIRFKELVSGEVVSGKALESPAFEILITDEVRTRMEDQFILVSDLENLLSECREDDAQGFYHLGRSTRIFSARSDTVTFWAEFLMEEETVRVTDTWCHRMTVAPSRDLQPGAAREDHDPGIRCAGCQKPLAFYKSHVEYLGSRFDVDLPRCPDCGSVYISPKLSRTKMAEVEQILEDK